MQLNDEKFQENEINSNFNMDLTSNKLVTPLLASTADMDTCNFTTISEKVTTLQSYIFTSLTNHLFFRNRLLMLKPC